MTTCNWLGRAKAVAEVVTVQVTAYDAATTYKFTLNGKTVSCIAAGSVNATATALAAAWTAATEADFTTAATASASTDTVTLTGVTKGVPFVAGFSKSVSGGTGTMGAATTATAATGPNHWNDANNWDSGAVPVNSDTANVNLSISSVLYGLDQSAVTLTLLNIYTTSQTSNTMGLPKINAAGYTEYLDDYLKIGATTWVMDAESPRIKVNFGSVQFSGEVRRSGTANDSPTPAILIRGTHTSNVLDVPAGTVGAAYYYGESFAAATITVGPSATLTLGSGTSTATTITSLGTLISNGVFTTLYVVGGQTTVNGTPGATTVDVTGGICNCQWSGTTTNVLVGPGTLDATQDATARTFTNTTIRSGGTINDLAQPTITYTNKVTRASGVTSLQAA